ncbi:hypothetical protein B0T20DRAFT_34436 [Sordaria brevicollis]|uniref:Uncharacterized protein n=1 Tax=Sordaria brevicollis TaxID=83679 RepID=A0AAE0P8T5_SORBR|nr:hypothetical protein B0T20DRAFT_34436 [Sordaria brevicollis]
MPLSYGFLASVLPTERAPPLSLSSTTPPHFNNTLALDAQQFATDRPQTLRVSRSLTDGLMLSYGLRVYRSWARILHVRISSIGKLKGHLDGEWHWMKIASSFNAVVSNDCPAQCRPPLLPLVSQHGMDGLTLRLREQPDSTTYLNARNARLGTNKTNHAGIV